MKKVISVLLVVILAFSMSSVAFAKAPEAPQIGIDDLGLEELTYVVEALLEATDLEITNAERTVIQTALEEANKVINSYYSTEKQYADALYHLKKAIVPLGLNEILTAIATSVFNYSQIQAVFSIFDFYLTAAEKKSAGDAIDAYEDLLYGESDAINFAGFKKANEDYRTLLDTILYSKTFDKAALQLFITNSEVFLNSENIFEEDAAFLTTEIAAAKAVYNNTAATADEINNAVQDLFFDLVAVQLSSTVVDYQVTASQLKQLIDEFQFYADNPEDYDLTDDDVTAIKAVLDSANAIADDPNSTTQQITEEFYKLLDLFDIVYPSYVPDVDDLLYVVEQLENILDVLDFYFSDAQSKIFQDAIDQINEIIAKGAYTYDDLDEAWNIFYTVTDFMYDDYLPATKDQLQTIVDKANKAIESGLYDTEWLEELVAEALDIIADKTATADEISMIFDNIVWGLINLETKRLIGDINNDGEVDLVDVVLIQKKLAKLVSFTDEQEFFADVNFDEKVDLADVVLIQKYIAKLVPSFGYATYYGD
ncbi:hypothetical protein AGMMS50284_0980 [Clostridia bacterium]|nr:hypothetical protein AGMMS50284_0980 [Clostridia bacterium]